MPADDTIDLSNACPHVTKETPRHARRPTAGCVDCLATGGSWVHLRICLTCGQVGRCDNSPNRHATAHYRKSRHPLITSGELGETWAYCYPDDQFLSEG
jgi:uncharacterized UBP type Zn finger protein